MTPRIDKLLSKNVIFVSGKGGTGKSTFSTLLANYAAFQGKRVLLVEHSGKPILSFFTGKELVQNVSYLNSFIQW